MLIALGLLAGLTLVVLGADWLVRGASAAAVDLGMPPLLVGMTVIAYGTSAPEFAVSVQAALAGRPELAVANVVGSNVFNVLAIVGLSALLTPLATQAQVVRREIPLMLMVTVGAIALGADGRLGRGDGYLLLALFFALTLAAIRHARAHPTADARRARPAAAHLARHAALVVAGLALLILGARWLVDAASAGAAALGVSQLVIGLTVVAIGTSVPELATSLVAAARGQRDLAIGNVVGSNVFNLVAILGTAAATNTLPVAPQVLALDAWVMLAAAAVLWPMAWTRRTIVRWEGALLLVAYLAYLATVVQIALGAWPVPPPVLVAAIVGAPLALVLLTAAIGRAQRR